MPEDRKSECTIRCALYKQQPSSNNYLKEVATERNENILFESGVRSLKITPRGDLQINRDIEL